MTDPVTNNYSFILPTVGSDLNLWGGLLNNGVFNALDATLGSSLAVTVTSTDVTLTTSQFQNAVFVCSGALTGNHSLILPLGPNSATVAVGGRFIVVNNTTGAYNLTVLTAASGSTGVTVPQGFAANLYSDGTNVGYGSSGLPAYAMAVNGNPNGQLAGVAASVNTNAQLAYDYIGNSLYVCVLTGTSTTAVWANPGAIIQPTPEGYLTPTSNTPVIPGDVIAATVIYYTPFEGTWAAVHNGVSIIPYRFSQMALTLSTSQASNNIYDVYLAYNAGTPVIGTGPSWASGSGGSVAAGSCARGTGSGGAAINRDATTGLWVNTASMSLIWNTGSGNTTITVAAGQGVYLGSIYIDSTAGQVTCHRSAGQSRKWGIWNGYNRQNVTLQVHDTTTSWGSAPAQPTWGPVDTNTANSFTSFCGLPEEEIYSFYQCYCSALAAGPGGFVSIGYNSTTTPSGNVGTGSTGISGYLLSSLQSQYVAPPTLGINTFTALESATTGVTFFGTQGGGISMLMTGAYKA